MHKKTLFIIFSLTAALLTGCNENLSSKTPETTITPAVPVAPTTEMEETKTTPTEKKSSVLIPYTQEKLSELKGSQKFALYFSASWCPKCRNTKKAIAETPEKFSGVTLLDVDYDTANELKKEYGITLQHSFVFFDEKGNKTGILVMPTDEDMIAFFHDSSITNPKKSTASKEQTSAMLEKPMYVTYSDQLYSSLLSKKPFVLFFHAPWCPTCRVMESAILPDLENFPAGTAIVKTDYDTMTDLKKKYGIVSQSTMVFFNAKGEVVKTLMAPNNDAIKEAIQSTL